MSRFAVLVSVGPGDREIQRTADFLDSLVCSVPGGCLVVLVDDSVSSRKLTTVLSIPKEFELVSIPNPRMGKGHGWSGGLTVGILSGMAWIQKNRSDVGFVLKADTDTLILAPFAEKIQARFQELPDVGILGSYLREPNGKRRDNTGWVPSIRTFLSAVCLRGKYLQITLWGRPRKIKLALIEAMKNGYQLSEHCQGGGYAVRAEMLKRMDSRGYLDDPLSWLRSGLTEDVMMGLYTHAVGMRMADFNQPNEPFGVQYQGLPGRPEELLARGYSIIHSIKDHGDMKEDDTRAYFQRVRHPISSKSGA